MPRNFFNNFFNGSGLRTRTRRTRSFLPNSNLNSKNKIVELELALEINDILSKFEFIFISTISLKRYIKSIKIFIEN